MFPLDLRCGTFRAAVALLVTLALTLGACRNGTEEAQLTEDPSTPRRGGTVVVGLTSDIGGVNEYVLSSVSLSDEVLYRLFLQLLEEQPDFSDSPPSFLPRLARSWEFSEDRKTLTFHLRDDVSWSDGHPVTAEDVRFSWQAQIHPDVAWDVSYMKEAVTDVEVVDDHTVRFHFSRVYPAQLVHANEGLIIPAHIWGELPFSEWRERGGAWFREHLVTNGPFVLESWRPQEELVLARNELYFEPDVPYLDRVVFRVIPQQSSQVTQLLGGRLDFVRGLPPEAVPRIESTPDTELLTYWTRVVVWTVWNNEHPLFADSRVRRALTLGVDRAGIVESVWGPEGRIAVSPFPSFVWAYADELEPLPYDPAAARELLDAAGWLDRDGDGTREKDGRELSFELLVNSGNREREDAAVIMQEQLGRIGVDVKPRLLDMNTLAIQITRGDFEAVLTGTAIGTDLDLKPLFHSESIGYGNYSRIREAELDRVLEQAGVQPTLEQALPYLIEAQRILHEEQPITFLWQSKRFNAHRSRLRNLEPNVLGDFYRMRYWWAADAG